MNEGNKQMSAFDPRLQFFEGIIPPAEWACVVDGTMHRFDNDKTMRFSADTYRLLLELTKRKNLSVVFVGSDLDGDHARAQFESIGQNSFPWIQCINEHTNAKAFLSLAKFVIVNQTPLAAVPAENGVPTYQLEVDPKIPRPMYGQNHHFISVDQHHTIFDHIDKII